MCTGTNGIDIAGRTERWTLRWIGREAEELITRCTAAYATQRVRANLNWRTYSR